MPLTRVQLATGDAYVWPPAYPPLPASAGASYAPPDTDDLLTAPDADFLGRQVQKLAPRGRAWNTDETAAPWGSKIQHGVWLLIGHALADLYAVLTRSLRSAFPGRADVEAIADWENDLGLPDPCAGIPDGLSQRRQAVQAARLAVEGASRHDMLRLLQRTGASPDVTITERRGLECGWSGLGEAGLCEPEAVHSFYIAGPSRVIWLEAGASPLPAPLGSLEIDISLCAIDRARHSHTKAIFEPSEA